jgi:crossover junction endodeoxyribonuclease RuvC
VNVVIGVDPGATGAIAALDTDGGIVAVHDMPHHGGIVSPALIADILSDLRLAHDLAVAWVERVHAMPRQGVSSSFKFGDAYGTVKGVLGGARVPLELVTPGKWKGDAGLTSDKGASRRRAIELWPEHSATFARVKDDGRAEACLIARHGLLQRSGGGNGA